MRVGTRFLLNSNVKRTFGSSPCVWGQVYRISIAKNTIRIIPMRVGTRPVPLMENCQIYNHPHACGDKAPNGDFIIFDEGSSPCVWGQAELVTIYGIRIGIIPMRVGTRRWRVKQQRQTRDHPHACGDKIA